MRGGQCAQGLLVKLADLFGQLRVDAVPGLFFTKELHLILNGLQSVTDGFLHGRQAAQLDFQLDHADGIAGELEVQRLAAVVQLLLDQLQPRDDTGDSPIDLGHVLGVEAEQALQAGREGRFIGAPLASERLCQARGLEEAGEGERAVVQGIGHGERRVTRGSGFLEASALNRDLADARQFHDGVVHLGDDGVGEGAVRRGELDADVHVTIDDIDFLDKTEFDHVVAKLRVVYAFECGQDHVFGYGHGRVPLGIVLLSGQSSRSDRVVPDTPRRGQPCRNGCRPTPLQIGRAPADNPSRASDKHPGGERVRPRRPTKFLATVREPRMSKHRS